MLCPLRIKSCLSDRSQLGLGECAILGGLMTDGCGAGGLSLLLPMMDKRRDMN